MEDTPTREGPRPATGVIWSQDEVGRRLQASDGHWRTVRDAVVTGTVGCVLFGAALGSHAGQSAQVLASAVKVPLVLLGTALLCFPAFYVLQSVRDSRPVSVGRAAAAQAAALAAIGVTWGGLAPPLVFLVVSTAHYKLAQVLSLLIGVVGGLVGLARFRSSLRVVCEVEGLRLRSEVMVLYLVLFAAVGGQLAWVLRPFIGDPGQPFQWFRRLGGSMFSHVLGLIGG